MNCLPLKPLAARISSTVVPYLAAIEARESPVCTTYTPPVGGGTGLSVGINVGVSVAVGVAVGGTGVGEDVGVRLDVGAAVSGIGAGEDVGVSVTVYARSTGRGVTLALSFTGADVTVGVLVARAITSMSVGNAVVAEFVMASVASSEVDRPAKYTDSCCAVSLAFSLAYPTTQLAPSTTLGATSTEIS